MLKPAAGTPEDAFVVSLFRQLHALDGDVGFRVPRPIPATDGRWFVDGWQAWAYVPGATAGVREWPAIVGASRSFHRAVARVVRERPSFLGTRDDPWSMGDRVAWSGEAFDGGGALGDLVSRLQAVMRPVDLPDQLVHGDIGGNVLVEPGLPPAVIDMAAYWRPAGWAIAVAAADLMAWSGAPASILDVDGVGDSQLLARALVYRLVTDAIARRGDAVALEASRRAHAPVVELVVVRSASCR
ncbi:MAG TPA: hypothetical protein VF228_21185 [Iamia sp.]